MARFESSLTYDDKATIVRREHDTTREAIVLTGHKATKVVGKRIADEHDTTREAIVLTGHKATKVVNQHVSDEHSETRRHSDANRDYIVDQLGGTLTGWQIFISMIIAILAGVGTWFASKGYILKDILDANGNAVRQEPFIPYITLLVVLAAVAAFYVTAAILSFFERRR